MKKLTHPVLATVFISCLVLQWSSCTDDNAARQDDTPLRIGIAWRGDSTAITFTSTLQSVREAGAIPVVLPLLKSPFMEYEGEQLMARYTDDHGIVLQEYADKVKTDPFAGQDIASLLQGLDGLVFTGGSDISPTLYKIPEPWHDQAVLNVEGTPLKVTAITKTNGIDIIEAVERTDKPFFIGLQYHPEVAVTKHSNGAADASRFMEYEDALCYFRALVNQGKRKHKIQ